jgi:hypothetical protein
VALQPASTRAPSAREPSGTLSTHNELFDTSNENVTKLHSGDYIEISSLSDVHKGGSADVSIKTHSGNAYISHKTKLFTASSWAELQSWLSKWALIRANAPSPGPALENCALHDQAYIRHLEKVGKLVSVQGLQLIHEHVARARAKAKEPMSPLPTNMDIYMIMLGHKLASPRTCASCGSFDHPLCVRKPSPSLDTTPRPHTPTPHCDSQPPSRSACRNWNSGRTCHRIPCQHQHVCSTCGGSHTRTECPKSGKPAPKVSGKRKK